MAIVVAGDAGLRPGPPPRAAVPILLGVLLLAPARGGAAAAAEAQEPAGDTVDAEPAITAETLRAAERIIGLEFTDAERELMLTEQQAFGGVIGRLEAYRKLREAEIGNDDPPALFFRPWPPSRSPAEREPRFERPAEVRRPARLEEVAFWPVVRLAELVRTRQVTSLELTRMYLERLKRHDSVLHAVVTLTEERALEAARRADREIEAGRYRGPLHGIPYGAKDLFALPGLPTTWGARPYRDRHIDETATVIERLEEAGAVLVAKLSLGALAWGDVWFGGKTRNPWNPEEGSSGSSAGSAAAVAAGLVPFALGTETLGSIVSPATRTGVTGLRPSFGRVSRQGAMVVSWSMDKVGPLCRSVEDCALVFDALRGPDGRDPTVVDTPFPYRPEVDLRELRIGYLASAFEGDYEGASADQEVLEVLRGLGAELIPVELPDRPVGALGFILAAEAAAAHDRLTRTDRDSLLVRQEVNAWPNVLRSARFVPAVEYLRANQLRRVMGREMRELFEEVDVYVAPGFRGGNLLVTNLTGHPTVVVPNGFVDEDSPTSVVFVGRMYGEAEALAVAKAYQEATEWHARRPPRFAP